MSLKCLSGASLTSSRMTESGLNLRSAILKLPQLLIPVRELFVHYESVEFNNSTPSSNIATGNASYKR